MFDQNQEKPSRSKVESALDALKDAALYNEKDEMQSFIFKFKKLHCTERLNSLKKKKNIFKKLFNVAEVIIWDKDLFYTFE